MPMAHSRATPQFASSPWVFLGLLIVFGTASQALRLRLASVSVPPAGWTARAPWGRLGRLPGVLESPAPPATDPRPPGGLQWPHSAPARPPAACPALRFGRHLLLSPKQEGRGDGAHHCADPQRWPGAHHPKRFSEGGWFIVFGLARNRRLRGALVDQLAEVVESSPRPAGADVPRALWPRSAPVEPASSHRACWC